MAFILLWQIIACCALAGPIDPGEIRAQMSREVEDEFGGDAAKERLALLREKFDEEHLDRANFVHEMTVFEINSNRTDLFEGDMELTRRQWEVAVDYSPENPKHRRQALSGTASLWQPIGAPVVPYVIPPEFPTQYIQLLRDGMAYWQQRTCVTFRPAGADTSAIIFSANSTGCWSYVGKQATRQQLNLHNPYCMSMNTLLHELSHALGTLHVQSRPDRDWMVEVDWTNIEPGQEHNFKMEPETTVSTHGVPYEYQSTMHYHPFAFAINTSRPTLYADSYQAHFQGSMDGPRPTFWDVALINRMYKCLDKCTTQPPCQNYGFTDARDCTKCYCPRGWTGDYCQHRPANAVQINVTSQQALFVTMDGPFNGYEERLYILTAPVGQHVKAYFANWEGPSFSFCRSIGVELQFITDTRRSGAKNCGKTPLGSPTIVWYSNENVMMLWAYRDVDVSFKASYMIEPYINPGK